MTKKITVSDKAYADAAQAASGKAAQEGRIVDAVLLAAVADKAREDNTKTGNNQ